MSSLVPSTGYGADPSRFESKQTSRGLAQIRSSGTLVAAGIESAAELQALKAEGLAYVGSKAMQQIALLSQLEQQLSTTVTFASSRLQAIGDITAMAMSEVVLDTVRRLR